MEALFTFLIRVCITSTLMYIGYLLLLRRTTFFKTTRYYLIATIIIPVLIAALPIQYKVNIPLTNVNLPEIQQNLNISQLSDIANATKSKETWSLSVFVTYVTGIIFLLVRLIIHTVRPIRLIQNEDKQTHGKYQIHRNKYYPMPFSFFNHIFIHSDYHKQEDLETIIAHEEVHIREYHWIDLLIIELFILLFWFNPVSWLIEQAIKQNHEYLADQGVISRGQSPVRYQYLLVNQLMGMQVLGLTNNLNFALGPTRFNMMKKKKTPKKQLLRLLAIVPILCVVLYAFAEPVYLSDTDSDNSTTGEMVQNENVKISGIVTDEEGEPLPGTSIVLKGTTIGTTTDMNGQFKLEIPPMKEFALIPYFVGYEGSSNEATIDKDKDEWYYKITMKRKTIWINSDIEVLKNQPPPPPPPPVVKVRTKEGEKMHIVPDEPGKNEEVFFVVEELPQYPNGQIALAEYIHRKTNEALEPAFFEGHNIKGKKSTIGFTVKADGSIDNFKILKSSGSKFADDKAIEILKGMEKWSPGKQRGKPVKVDYSVDIEF